MRKYMQRALTLLCCIVVFNLFGQIRPEVAYGELFKDVQLKAIFPDSKTFADCIPKKNLDEIVKIYQLEKGTPGFVLKEFVLKYFALPTTSGVNFTSDQNAPVKDHIQSLWPVLTRNGDKPQGSLIPLPNPYVVPGGRFREIYYWDSYFTMLGLAESGKTDLVESMIDNFAYLIDTLGFVPNGNRTYFTGRSQPPFFALMVTLLADLKGEKIYEKYLPQLEKEYLFWMNGKERLNKINNAHRRIVMLNRNEFLNRYWDDRPEPRPESYKEDVELAESSNREHKQLYRDIRAACESGWDFSSRWFRDNQNLATIHTTEIIPIDLNCLLYHLEETIAKAYSLQGKAEKAISYEKLSESRRKTILKYCWNGKFFVDYDFIKKKSTERYSLAGAFPLFFELATPKQAKFVSKIIQADFLKEGGLITTKAATGQQWDAPNGWAPLHWITIKGLRNYNITKLSQAIADRWIALNERVFKQTGKLVEKYNVTDNSLEAGGGEYPLQDGFGWTNGVLRKLISEK